MALLLDAILKKTNSIHYRLDKFSVFLESSLVFDIIRRHPGLNLVSQPLQDIQQTLNFKLAAN